MKNDKQYVTWLIQHIGRRPALLLVSIAKVVGFMGLGAIGAILVVVAPYVLGIALQWLWTGDWGDPAGKFVFWGWVLLVVLVVMPLFVWRFYEAMSEDYPERKRQEDHEEQDEVLIDEPVQPKPLSSIKVRTRIGNIRHIKTSRPLFDSPEDYLIDEEPCDE